MIEAHQQVKYKDHNVKKPKKVVNLNKERQFLSIQEQMRCDPRTRLL
jgi:hypothetical protein